jgi:hypothetical protein
MDTENKTQAPPPQLNEQASAAYMRTLKAAEPMIRATYLQGFDDGAKTALITIASKIKQDAQNNSNYAPMIKSVLMDVARFIDAVVTGGSIRAGESVVQGPGDQSTDTIKGESHGKHEEGSAEAKGHA